MDRRNGARLPMRLPLQYRVISEKAVAKTGAGQTCNLSRTGVLFESDAALHEGNSVELLIEWPAPFHGEEPMRLLMCGTVTRHEDVRAALKVVYYDFLPSHAVETLKDPVYPRATRKRSTLAK